MGTTITWDKERRDQFARFWPCCDVPDEGWFEIDSNGCIVDISDNTTHCESGGGLYEFTITVQAEFLRWNKVITEQAAYYNMTVEQFEKYTENLAAWCEKMDGSCD